MSGPAALPKYGAFSDEAFPTRVILLFRSGGSWHLSTVLCRRGQEPPAYVGEWTEPWSDRGIVDDWRYLEERILEGRYGNGHTFEIQGFAVYSVDDAERIALASAAEVVAASHGPMGEVSGTFADNDADGMVWMPFVVLVEGGRVLLVATDSTPEKPVILTSPQGTIESETFQSATHWQRSGERAWELVPGVQYHLWWSAGEAYLTVAADGRIVGLDDEPAPVEAPVDTTDVGQDDHPTRERRPDSSHADSSERLVRLTTSEDHAWGWAIPMVMRTAAGRAYDNRWPAAPDRTDPDSAHGYWTALHHLLLYSFGWRRPDRGLRWWYEAGHPTGDRRLRLIAETYLADGQLGWYHAWLCRSHANMISYETPSDGFDLNPDDIVDRDWLEEQLEAAASADVPDPLTGGGDPLHLSYHAGGPNEAVEAPTELRRTGRGGRSGILLCDSAVGWYRALDEQAMKLPSIDDHRWHIDVVIKPIGWIGTYRRSPKTGLWYVGSHRVHLRGS